MSEENMDTEAEREIDLKRWRHAIAKRWWIVVIGVAAGIILGALYSLAGGSTYQASVLIAPGQAFNQSGAPVITYASTPRGINAIVLEESSLKEAAGKAGIAVGNLRGHVSTATVNTGAGTATTRGGQLIRITAQLHKAENAEQVANALGAIVQERSTGRFVRNQITALNASIASTQRQLTSVGKELQRYNAIDATSLAPFDQLLLQTQIDNRILQQGNLTDTLNQLQGQLTLAQTVELAQIITKAAAEKTTARSRKNSVLVGALIGLLLGIIAALIVESRAARPQPTAQTA